MQLKQRKPWGESLFIFFLFSLAEQLANTEEIIAASF